MSINTIAICSCPAHMPKMSCLCAETLHRKKAVVQYNKNWILLLVRTESILLHGTEDRYREYRIHAWMAFHTFTDCFSSTQGRKLLKGILIPSDQTNQIQTSVLAWLGLHTVPFFIKMSETKINSEFAIAVFVLKIATSKMPLNLASHSPAIKPDGRLILSASPQGFFSLMGSF